MPDCTCCTLETAAPSAHGLCPDCAWCLHCDQAEATTWLGLCAACYAQPGFRRLYSRRMSRGPHKWSPARERRVRETTRRYQIEKLRKELAS